MKTLPEVEKAKLLMTEAMHWSVMKWLREKRTVRRIADQANAALDELGDRVKQGWPPSVLAAYEALVSAEGAPRASRKANEQSLNGRAAASKCKQADEEAYRARLLAEETFDRAERMLSPSLAREGCSIAIRSWELKEKAIHMAEKIARSGAI